MSGKTLRFLAPNGHLGFAPLKPGSFELGVAAHPDFIVLLNDENRGGARHVRGSKRLEAMHSPLVSMVSTILKQGVQNGSFRKGVDPVQLYISIAGLSYFFFSNTATLSAIFGKDLRQPAARRARRKHVVDLVMQSLRP